MLHIKVKGGTPTSGKTLCMTCKNAAIVRGQNGEQMIFCSRLFWRDGHKAPVPFKISECSDFHPTNMPWMHEMEEMAWKIEARRRGPSGFQPETTEMEVTITPPKGDGGEPEM